MLFVNYPEFSSRKINCLLNVDNRFVYDLNCQVVMTVIINMMLYTVLI